jgi:multidrug efflux pump subunit AcrA (membrane-fusion protein)
MSSQKNTRLRVLWIVPPVIVGVLFMIFMTGGKQPPVKSERGEPVRAVRIISISSMDLLPAAEGYGTVQPSKVWTAVAQVSGRIIDMHAKLRNGEILPADTLLYRIDPVDYELKLAQAQAELVELDVLEQNAKASLAIEQRNHDVAKRELERLRKLVKKGTVSQNDADKAERTLLQIRAATQNQQNNLALIPIQRRLLESRLNQAERDLSNTEVRSPFNIRIADHAIEMGQYVSKGQNLFKGDSVDRVEVTAQVALSSLRHLFLGRPDVPENLEQFNQPGSGWIYWISSYPASGHGQLHCQMGCRVCAL